MNFRGLCWYCKTSIKHCRKWTDLYIHVYMYYAELYLDESMLNLVMELTLRLFAVCSVGEYKSDG